MARKTGRTEGGYKEVRTHLYMEFALGDEAVGDMEGLSQRLHDAMEREVGAIDQVIKREFPEGKDFSLVQGEYDFERGVYGLDLVGWVPLTERELVTAEKQRLNNEYQTKLARINKKINTIRSAANTLIETHMDDAEAMKTSLLPLQHELKGLLETRRSVESLKPE